MAFACVPAAAASAYYGKVTFNGQPLPGATIIATQGAKKFTTTSDAGGVYHFDNLPDGLWEIEVEMQLFAPIHAEVTVGPKTPASDFALTPLPMSELEANAEPAKNALRNTECGRGDEAGKQAGGRGQSGRTGAASSGRE